MTWIILASLFVGILSGYFFLPENIIDNLDILASFALNLLILSVGIDIGYNKEIFTELGKMGIKILLIPVSIILGSWIGGSLCSFIFQTPLPVSLSIASGFGWYSLSGVLISDLGNIEAGTIAFLTNVFREVIAIITIPFLAKYLNFFTVIAPAGATSMDSTLPLIAESTNQEISVIAFINGAILSALVPIFVTFFMSL